MQLKPFLKWAGGKRWLLERREFSVPNFAGRYIEPFLGGGAVFFYLQPEKAILSDSNHRLIETYQQLKHSSATVWHHLNLHHINHNKLYYYKVRKMSYDNAIERASQFIYLNRSCWNGLYRENLKGEFNVPIGNKKTIVFEDDCFDSISISLQNAEIHCCDFQSTILQAQEGDFVFVDPPYTTAHNFNGFVKYNQNIFTWDDQIRLRNCVLEAVDRGAQVLLTNACHNSIHELYDGFADIVTVDRPSVISGKNTGRRNVAELVIRLGYHETRQC